MSASPPCTTPRRPFHGRSDSQNNNTGIRLVPYSPPLISADSIKSRSNTSTDASVEAQSEHLAGYGSSVAPSSPYNESPSPGAVWKTIRPTDATSSIRPLKFTTPQSSSPCRPLSDAEPDTDADNHDDSFESSGDASPSPGQSPRPPSRRRIINVHADKTFSIHPQNLSTSTSSRTDSIWSNQHSYTTRSSSYGRQSMGAFSDDHQEHPSSPLTPLTERSSSKSPMTTPVPAPRAQINQRMSPWNYRMLGGVRKVPRAPDIKQKQRQSQTPLVLSAEMPLPSLPEIQPTNPIDVPSTQQLNEKISFLSTNSSQSKSTLSDRTNYKIYGQSSPVTAGELDSLPASSIHSNYEIIGGPSSSEPSVYDRTRPHTRESEANYVVHGGASSTSSVVAVRHRLRNEFSQESLMVAPLRPTRKRSWESFGVVKTRSHDSLRTGSLTSLSTVMTQEATRALFVGPATMLHQVGPSWQSSMVSSKAPSGPRPHQWSSQLSTVFSESEVDSESASRALSLSSFADRRSSSHSKHLLNMMNSLADLEEETTDEFSHSRTPSLEPPAPAFNRNMFRDPQSGPVRLIRDHDEDGDGLAELADIEMLRHRPSRTRMGKMLSHYASDRSLGSTASMNSTIPTWARVYYGSGERKWLAYKPSSESMFSNFSFTDSQAGGHSHSPSLDRFVPSIFSSRRRPGNPVAEYGGHRDSVPDSAEMGPLSSNPVIHVMRSLKKQTSSIWSPHLGKDRRPVRQSIWEPPVADWEARSELAGKRNAQITMFVVGFILPLSWMIASLVPLPTKSTLQDEEQGRTTVKEQVADDDMHRSAVWWRNINRVMSAIGLIVLGAVIALVVVGIKQRWGH